MPAKSGKQYRMAAARCHGKAKGKGGMSKKVACEMVSATPAKKRSSFSKKRKKK